MALTLIHSDAIARDFEREVTRLLAGGQLGAVNRLLAGRGPTLFTDLVALDVRSRLLDADLSELQAVKERLGDDPSAWARYGLWAEAMIAERMLLDGDPASGMWAASLLREATTEPYPPVPVLFARARLRRLAALGFLGEPTPANRTAFRTCRDGAIDDFVRCDFRVEAAATSAVTAGFHLVRTHEEPRQTLDRIAEARAVLADAPESEWRAVLDATWGMASLHVGDPVTAVPALAGADRPDVHPLARLTARFGLALTNLVAAAGDPAALPAVDAAVEEARRTGFRHGASLQNITAHILADFGRPEMARYARPGLEPPPPGEVDGLDARMLRLRADLVAGVVPPAAEVKAMLGELVELRLRRFAGVSAVRIARDYDRVDQRGEADTLRQWGLELLPPPAEHTLAEQVMCQPVDGPPIVVRSTPAPAPAAVRDAATVVRVLEPVVTIEADGMTAPLRDTGAKLVLALAVRHPRPMHLEEVADLLWPGTDPRLVRSRLNSLVHRLRSSAALGPALGRTGDLLALDETRCTLDLVEFRAALAGTDDERRAALGRVRSNLCESQFPYEEPFIAERHAFCALWLDHARHLVAAGVVTPTELTSPLAALGLEAGDLT